MLYLLSLASHLVGATDYLEFIRQLELEEERRLENVTLISRELEENFSADPTERLFHPYSDW